MKLRTILLGLIFGFALLSTSFAAIIVENRTGAVKIYMPDGKQLVIQRNEPMPVIPDGATITILGGSAVISTTGKSVVPVSIGNYTLQVSEGSKVNLTLNPDGTVTSTIILGSVNIDRKAEAFRNPRVPNATELGLTTGRETKGYTSNHL